MNKDELHALLGPTPEERAALKRLRQQIRDNPTELDPTLLTHVVVEENEPQ